METQDQPPEAPSSFQPLTKRLKAALIIIAKASYHKTFVETCLTRNQPPKGMKLWSEPHIYHSNNQIEKEWRQILEAASLSLLSALIRHYTSVIREEKQTIRELEEQADKIIRESPDQETKQSEWIASCTEATAEAKTLSDRGTTRRKGEETNKKKKNQRHR